MKKTKKTVLAILIFVSFIPSTLIWGKDEQAKRTIVTYGDLMSDIAKPAHRSPGSPSYEDICFSPRRTSWGKRDVVEVAKAFFATRIEWLYADAGDKEIIQRMRDLGLKIGLAASSGEWDTPDKREGAVGFKAHPEYYTLGRILDIEGKVGDEGRGSMHDPQYEEVIKRWLRLYAEFKPNSIQRDEPEWGLQDWDFNPNALSQFNDYLTKRVTPDKLAKIGISDPAKFDLKAFVKENNREKMVILKPMWLQFRTERLLNWYSNLRKWTAEIMGSNVEWSANYSSFLQYTPERLWSDFAIAELQPSGTRFGIGDPWSLYKKVQISRELGKAMIFTLGSHDIYENKVMIGLTYALGTHMICPYGVYMKNSPRKFDDPALYADIYGFVNKWGKTYLAGYEEAFAYGNGIIHPLTACGKAPLKIEDKQGAVYAFVRAKPNDPNAPVVIHLVNWSKTANQKILMTLDPNRFFPGHGLKITQLTKGENPKVLSDGFQARVELDSPEPWAMLIIEPASSSVNKIWAPEVETESFDFFDKTYAILTSRTENAEIRYTLDGSNPSKKSILFTNPIIVTKNTVVKTAAFSSGVKSNTSLFTFTKTVPNAITTPAQTTPGLAYELLKGAKVSKDEVNDDPMKWTGATYTFEEKIPGTTPTIKLPSGCPPSMFAVNFNGYLYIQQNGLYTFYVNVDDECKLFIDDELIINQTGRKVADLAMTEFMINRLLSSGYHKIKIEYLQKYDNYGLDVKWKGPEFFKQPIPATVLSH